MRPLFCIVAIVIILASCERTETHKKSASEYFPNSVGNYWRYKHVDSGSNKSVLVDVNIIGSTVLPGGQIAKIWTFTFPDYIDTSFVYQVVDTIKFVDRGLSIRNAYILPLQLNNQWRQNPNYIHDSIRVTQNRSYYLNKQNFDNSFSLHGYGYLPNERWDRLEWFCPNIGMLTKIEKDAFLIANTVSAFYWELIDYDLK